jgi:23S rRNA (cytosine1962-C5)-methyltransferase
MAGFQEGLSTVLSRAWRARESLVRAQKLEAFRLIHGAADGLAGLKLDAFGGAWLATLESEKWIEAAAAVEEAIQGLQDFIFPHRPPTCHFVANLPKRREALAEKAPEKIIVSEDGLRFEVQLGLGPHAGLFLDQRENRRETRKLADGRRCLNLFCYTGSFSMAALAGGASEVVSVDLSKKTLAWLDRNRELNGFDARRCITQATDAWEYLEKAAKKSERFDLILLDPPSFGRGAKGSFRLAQDFEKLVVKAGTLLQPRGEMLVSLNLESLSLAEFRKRLKLALKSLGRQILREVPLPFDFPSSPGRDSHLKSAWC